MMLDNNKEILIDKTIDRPIYEMPNETQLEFYWCNINDFQPLIPQNSTPIT